MTRISDIKFSSAPTFEPTTLARELGETKTDTIQSAAQEPATEQGEGFFKRMICCIPRCILSFVKKVICLVTLGCFCNTKDLTEKELREVIIADLAKLQQIWLSAPSMQERKAVGEEVFNKHPELKEKIAIFGVNGERRSYLNHKREATTPEEQKKRQQEIDQWNERHFAAVKKDMIERLDIRFDAAFIQNYIKFLRDQNDNN